MAVRVKASPRWSTASVTCLAKVRAIVLGLHALKYALAELRGDPNGVNASVQARGPGQRAAGREQHL